MSNIQQQIKDAEVAAMDELNTAKGKLAEKSDEAVKKSKDILSSAQYDADTSFSSKKELLEKKLESKKNESSVSLVKKIKDLDATKSELIKKGVSFLLTRLTK